MGVLGALEGGAEGLPADDIDSVCMYQDRYRSKCCRNLKFEPQFCEGVGFAHLACRIGKFTLRVFIREIYQYIAFYLDLTIPPSRRLAHSSCQFASAGVRHR